MSTMTDIEKSAQALAEARDAVSAIVMRMHKAIEDVQRAEIPLLKRAVSRAAERRDKLARQIEDAPQEFVKPRTVVMHGLKVGYKLGNGKMVIEDEDLTIKLIRRHFIDRFDELVKTEESPRKAALNTMTSAELKRIGVSVESSGDVVVIAAVDSAVDKLVKALLKSASDEFEEAAS